eukprot:TRINITY_DN71152_c0_g1_i1.p1 TRINITY_DN71152_c0_g1~~TRINITY_DN71152_c0_g1_i1.p1  ORF type:complete len:1645 (-),score=40.75 TRINITY_DN71152_c0_g1_i1:653-5587(-)
MIQQGQHRNNYQGQQQQLYKSYQSINKVMLSIRIIRCSLYLSKQKDYNMHKRRILFAVSLIVTFAFIDSFAILSQCLRSRCLEQPLQIVPLAIIRLALIVPCIGVIEPIYGSALLLLVNSHVAKGDPPSSQIIERIGGEGDDEGFAIIKSGGNYYTAGSDSYQGSATEIKYCITKIDLDGSVDWRGRGGSQFNQAFALVRGPNGDIIAVGEGGGSVAKLWVLESDGDEDNIMTVSEIGQKAFGIARDSSGNGYLVVGTNGAEATVAFLTNTFSTSWNHAEATIQDYRGVVEHIPSTFAVVGNTPTKQCTYKYYDVWGTEHVTVTDISYAPGNLNYCYAITKLADGNLAIAGWTSPGENGNNKDALIVKISPAGVILWKKAVGFSQDEEARGIKEMPNGNLALAGYTTSKGDGGQDAWILVTDMNGNYIYDKTFGGDRDDYFNGIDVDSSGTISAIGTYTKDGDDAKEMYLVVMRYCLPGTYYSNSFDSCVPCPEGRYQDEPDKHHCKKCDPGTYQDLQGQISCKPCEEGTAQNLEGKSSCPQCLPGTVQPLTGKSSCDDCEPGHYQNLYGQTTCKQCDPGTFASSYGQDQCADCDPGSYQDLPGQASCKYCDPGTAQNTPGSTTTCPQCDPGYYQDSSGKTTCIACDEGTAQNLSGQTKCTSCQPGYYQDTEGQISCKACPSGTYQDLFGQSKCNPCHHMCLTCHGPTYTDCDSCHPTLNLEPSDGSICVCRIGYYNDPLQASPVDYCQPCGRFCKSCSGTPDYCTSCIDNKGVIFNSNTCTCSGIGYFVYNNPDTLQDECVRCFPLCTKCNGPLSSQCHSCDSSKGAIFINPSTCQCDIELYYDSTSETCKPCSSLCKTCFGPGADQCYECNFPTAFPVEEVDHLCVTNCIELGGYFKAPDMCRSKFLANRAIRVQYCLQNMLWRKQYQLHRMCRFQQVHVLWRMPQFVSEWLLCNGRAHLSAQVQIYNQSIECHETCMECFTSGKSGCLSCQPGLLLHKGQCVEVCPDGTFPLGPICAECTPPCKDCLSLSECTTCMAPYYKVDNSSQCVLKCPSGTYAEETLRACIRCFYTCKTCIGSSPDQCLLCDIAKGVGKPTDAPGSCLPIVCPEGFYTSLDHDHNKLTCEPCHKSCLTCGNNGGSGDCIECKDGLVSIPSENSGKLYCKSCSEINPGFFTSPEGTCREVCGDGINLGQVECDDGNKLSGDGCDSTCKIENGYKCYHRDGLPDFCVDSAPPTATLRIEKGNVLTIIYSEEVIAHTDSNTLSKSLNVRLVGTRNSCNFTWTNIDSFPIYTPHKKFSLQAEVNCSLRGEAEIFYVELTEPSYVRDYANNSLQTTVLSARAKRYVYISKDQQAAVEGAGTSFSASSFLTFALVLGANLMQSAAVGAFWTFINMLQLISYVPIISCELPHNLEVFLTEYLTVGRVAFPFRLLPGYLPNPFAYFTAFITFPFNERFVVCGYESLSFIYNFAEQLITWLLLLGFYLLLRILTCCIPETTCSFIHKWRKDYEFNAVIRVLLECYLHLVFSSFLNIWLVNFPSFPNKTQLDMDTFSKKISLVAASAAAVLFSLQKNEIVSSVWFLGNQLAAIRKSDQNYEERRIQRILRNDHRRNRLQKVIPVQILLRDLLTSQILLRPGPHIAY